MVDFKATILLPRAVGQSPTFPQNGPDAALSTPPVFREIILQPLWESRVGLAFNSTVRLEGIVLYCGKFGDLVKFGGPYTHTAAICAWCVGSFGLR